MQINRLSFGAPVIHKPAMPVKSDLTGVQKPLKLNPTVDSFHFSGRPFITPETERLLDLACRQKDESPEEKRIILSRLTNEDVYQSGGENPIAKRGNLISKYERARDQVGASHLPEPQHVGVINWLQTCIDALEDPDSVPYVPTGSEYEPQAR